MARSPRRRIPFASVAAGLSAQRTLLDSNSLRQLDTSHGCRNHTLLPYATTPLVLRGSIAHSPRQSLRPPCNASRNAIASTAPRTPRIVTTRTPLFDEAGWRDDGADLGEMRSGIFLPAKLDDPNRVEMAGEIRAFAQRVWRCFGSETVRPWAETLIDVSRRQSAFSSWKGIGLSPQFMNNYCISLHG